MALPLAERIATAARRHPESTALFWQGRAVSYRDLLAMARAAEKNMAALRIPDGTPVAVVAAKSPETIAVMLACMRAARPVLVPSADVADKPLRKLLADTGALVLPDPCALTAGTAGPAVAGRPAEGRVPDGTALILTTSGSTGFPKAVPLPAAAIGAFAEWAAATFGIRADTSVLSYAPLNFDLSLLDVWTTLAHGGRVALVEQDRAAHPGHLLALLRQCPVHVVHGVPMLYQLLAAAEKHASGDEFAPVGEVLVTGDALSPGGLAALSGLFPRARMHNVYGCTETNHTFVHEMDPAGDVGRYGAVPIGRPAEGVGADILAEDGSVLAGPGRGELIVTSPFQTSGYLDPVHHAKAFVGHPDGTTPGPYYRTGDLVTRHPDGVLTLDGRSDFMVTVRGTRINTAAVEGALRSHPEVADAVVVALPDERTGRRLHAVVHRAAGSLLNSLRLREHVAAELPRAGIPSGIQFVDAPLPRTATGKIDRRTVANSL
ncbi:AMP-binding protein [Streptomyces sp. WMMC500]|uniref:AMP-binding protein n=1 Tax=Streptomyces sp. WMMC500 TaxID=3015154 RepID=UPI00248B52E9|nr:AMP-binding protein [Streptomyces sp. WMMC500]WBB60957.1 AMP-binding protein [Streptomyces sp. WMMC500]